METRPIPVTAPENVMDTIDQAFTNKTYNSDEFANAAMALFKEYRNAYQAEWRRMDCCEHLYLGDTWPLIEANAEVNGTNGGEADGCYSADSKLPKPTMPVIHSTVENLEADLYQDLPDCYVKPQDGLKDVDARLINLVLHRQLEDCGFNEHYFEETHELLVYGWTVFEVGYELKGVIDSKNFAPGKIFIRHVPSRSIMFDPNTSSVQDNRVIFKFEKHPAHWFKQHYPDKYEKMSLDLQNLNDRPQNADDPQMNVSQQDAMYFVEMWYRGFDAKTNKYHIHMAQFAGGVEVANSAQSKPNGMYEHGLYPFEIDVLYPRVGTPFAYGVPDVHSGLQLYIDKLNQIIMTSALRSSRGRVFISAANEEALDDITDFSKEAIKVNDINGVQWFQDKPLANYMMTYMQMLVQAIKEASGTTDQSRGIPGGGVTANSAIENLQAMATKRSSKVAERRQQMFKRLAAMAIDTLADCALIPYQAVVTVNGKPNVYEIDSKLFAAMQEADGRTPTSSVFIRVARQTRYAKKENNELALQFMQMNAGPGVDTTPYIEMMDFEDKELVLEKIRASKQTQMAQLMQQVQMLSEQVQQLQQENASYKQTMQRAQAAMTTRDQQMSQDRAAAPLQIPKGMAENAV